MPGMLSRSVLKAPGRLRTIRHTELDYFFASRFFFT